ncbi:hypothetical protein [Streptomyces sp. CAU 1734]|uniref:hypothetical protein n=1 Tax=Streptomyces sp. CAU 1734 TaxID=3140360 RepID=UPI0032615719
MTMRVYRVSPEGQRLPVSPTIVVGDPEAPPMPLAPIVSSDYPPCACPRENCPDRGGRELTPWNG